MDKSLIEESVRSILKAIGEEVDREGLRDTPRRVADMYEEVFSGIGQDPVEEIDVVIEANHDEMIMVKDISCVSFCMHHLVPFVGKAHVAYIPNDAGQITGLSKLARVVDVVSKRPQVQEKLTTQVAGAIEEALQPKGILVVIEAEHLCMTMRGVRKPGAKTVTSAVRGIFRQNEATRAEAMGLIFH
jgi:GTP cyclohydrolase I